MKVVIAPEVERALAAHKAVVALESSVLGQGLPYPENVEAHRRVTAAVRAEGVVPATVAVLHGNLCVGLVEEEVRRIAEGEFPKVGVRDLSFALATGGDGALTVSASVAAASLVGAPVLATGGLGGVHRGWRETLDISSDLHELARTRVAVVSSGVKSVLDARATLEVLESLCVPVVGVRTRTMPGFLVADTGFALEHSVDDEDACAALLDAHWGVFRRPTGVLFCNAVPKEHSLDRLVVEEAVERAVAQAESAGVTGKDVTPFLLRRLDNLTGGTSLAANIALLESNARVAARIALALERRAKA